MIFLAVWISILSTVTTAQARERVGDFFTAPSTVTTGEYGAQAAPKNNVLDQRLNLSQRLSQTATETWRANMRLGSFTSSNTLYPNTLWDLEGGISFDHKIDDTRNIGGRVSVGSASDVLFNTIHETVLQATAYYKLPSGERNFWYLVLNFSNNRSFANNIPIPGVAYILRSEDQKLNAVLGLPFASVNYKLTSMLAVRFNYFFPYDVSSEVSHTIVGPLRAYVAFDWSQNIWHRANRPDYKQRLFYDSKTASGGFRTPVSKILMLDISGGYAFGRRFFESSSILSSKTSDQDFAASPFAAAKISFRL